MLMKRYREKRTTAFVLVVLLLAAALVPVFAIGSFGVDLDSDAYSSDINPFTAAGYRGECTWYAWGRAYEKTGQRIPCLGNAKKWLDQSGSFGWDTTPSADSIAVWTDGEYGHVAYVEKVEGDVLYITHGNIRGHEYTEGTFNLSTSYYTDWTGLGGWYLTYKPAGYIHLVKEEEGLKVVPMAGDKLQKGRDYTVDGNVVTVSYSMPCRIGYLGEDGSYIPVTAEPVPEQDDTYLFNVPEGIEEVILVVKGDATLDGSVDLGDATRITAAFRHKYELSEEMIFAADITGDGSVNLGDAAKIMALFRKKTTVNW